MELPTGGADAKELSNESSDVSAMFWHWVSAPVTSPAIEAIARAIRTGLCCSSASHCKANKKKDDLVVIHHRSRDVLLHTEGSVVDLPQLRIERDLLT